ncbi:hypothetical protein RAB80_002445 [Fusarium oxysporum f. sp. vasinfectum]|nr:hypothetical protein RAB80_002445 [Fusarium oxysporum f. sp. vasinfectum]
MSRISPLFRQRLILAAKVAVGVSITGAASFHLVTRKCYFEPFGPDNGRSLYEHPLLKQINPWNKPGSADSCVREVPFDKLDKVLLEDAKNGGTKLVERFIAGMWGRIWIWYPTENHDILQERGKQERPMERRRIS